DEGLDDLCEVAADRIGGILGGQRPRGELLDARLDGHLAEELGDPLDRLRPSAQALLKSMKRTSVKPGSASTRSSTSGSGVLSSVSAIRAPFALCERRETAMLAMFTRAPPSKVPSRP